MNQAIHFRPAHTDAPLSSATLAAALRQAMRGEVRFDDTSRALYATDGSNYRQVPIGVVLPLDADDVAAGMAVCCDFMVPVLPRGGGTSLCGQCCNVAVVFDMSKYMNHILEIDPVRKIARIQPGVVLDDLRNAAERHGLTFAPDPSTHNHNTLGGMIGNNSCGPHSVMAGRTADNVVALDVLTYRGQRLRLGKAADMLADPSVAADTAQFVRDLQFLGQRYADEIRRRYPDIPRRVSGYNLDELLPEHGCNLARALVGTEGTCAMVLEATVQLVDSPPKRSLLVLGYPDVYQAADHVVEVMRAGPLAVEGIDDRLIADMRAIHMHQGDVAMLPEGKGWLLAEFGGATQAEADARAEQLMAQLKTHDDAPTMKRFSDKSDQDKLWQVRKSGLGATAHVPNKRITWEGWEDSAVPPQVLGDYLRELRKLFERHGYEGDLYGHFGQGCVHTRIDFDLETADGIARYRAFMDEASDLVLRFGGSLSGEHGDGQSKAEFLPKMFGERLMQAFRKFKTLWDPDGRMNPGKVVDAYRIDENLRLGADYAPMVPDTYFHYPDDAGDFNRAILRCVGVGECRKHDAGVMCPSYMATREEMHSTRGRAKLLFEMLRGDAVRDGWRDEGVREALDLCLSCKGCRGECPVNVDMATYKAEFMAHHYRWRLRPRAMYAFGLIDVWARMAALAPDLANALLGAPGLNALAKMAAGVTPQRTLPRFASQTFRSWFAQRPAAQHEGKAVILWADTFNNHFHPHVLHAATAVLEAAGFAVRIPEAPLCCGRPLYETGMLGLARRRLLGIAKALAEPLRQGVPIVVLEPACASVFRCESEGLLPCHEDIKRLRQQTFLLDEFLQRYAGHIAWPALNGRAVVHGHCHQQAVLKMDGEKRLLDELGLEVNMLDAGCCGMAGGFGYEASKYPLSVEIAERRLLPAIRQRGDDTLIIADGYSCREQIAQLGGRQALHLAEVLQRALAQEDKS